MIKHLLTAIVLLVFVAGGGMLMAARQDTPNARQDLKGAGRSVGRAAEKTGHNVKKDVKKGVHKSAHEVDKGARKVERKSESSPQP